MTRPIKIPPFTSRFPPPSLIYTWEKRFAEGGLDALFTKRSRPPMNKSPKKPVKYTDSELSELERLRLENRQLHIENDYLKKSKP